jgi:type 1 glutamine amidotransferase
MFIVTDVAPYRHGPAGVHRVLPQAVVALGELAEMASLEPVPVQVVPTVDPARLAAGGVLALFTIGETPWTDNQRAAIVDGVRSGRLAVLGMHAATDACASWPEYGALLGARFDGHPWTQDFDVRVVDGSHPATKHLSAMWRCHDEVYLFRDLRPDAHVLLEVAEGQLDMDAPGARRPDIGFPLAWCFTEGDGRVFYTALGHFSLPWETPDYLRHLQGGLAWLLGDGA